MNLISFLFGTGTDVDNNRRRSSRKDSIPDMHEFRAASDRHSRATKEFQEHTTNAVVGAALFSLKHVLVANGANMRSALDRLADKMK